MFRNFLNVAVPDQDVDVGKGFITLWGNQDRIADEQVAVRGASTFCSGVLTDRSLALVNAIGFMVQPLRAAIAKKV